MDWKYVVPIISVICVIVGWMLNECSYYFRCRHEDKRILKDVLFNLLEIWHLLKTNNPDMVVDITIKKLISKYPEISEGGFTVSVLKPFYKGFFEKLFQGISNEEVLKVQKRYELSIDALTGFDPLLAYRLSGKFVIRDYIKVLDERLADLKLEIFEINESEGKAVLEYLKQIIKPMFLDEEIQVIEKDILSVSRRINIITLLKMRNKLKQHDIWIQNEIDKKMTQYFDSITELFQSKLSGDQNVG